MGQFENFFHRNKPPAKLTRGARRGILLAPRKLRVKLVPYLARSRFSVNKRSSPISPNLLFSLVCKTIVGRIIKTIQAKSERCNFKVRF